MKNAIALTAIIAVLLPVAAAAHPAPEVIDLVWKFTGGKEQYEKARYLTFVFANEKDGGITGERHHTWDRYSGDYVVEFNDFKTGDPIKVYFNVQSKEGTVIKKGAVVEGEEAASYLDLAYRLFINDTFWLLVPTKLGDYGARTKFEGHEGDGLEHEQLIILHLFFDEGIGLTPGDNYWLFITHEGEIVRWKYELQGGSKAEFLWKDVKDCGMGVKLSTRRETLDGKRATVFPEVHFSDSMDQAVFTYSP